MKDYGGGCGVWYKVQQGTYITDGGTRLCNEGRSWEIFKNCWEIFTSLLTTPPLCYTYYSKRTGQLNHKSTLMYANTTFSISVSMLIVVKASCQSEKRFNSLRMQCPFLCLTTASAMNVAPKKNPTKFVQGVLTRREYSHLQTAWLISAET